MSHIMIIDTPKHLLTLQNGDRDLVYHDRQYLRKAGDYGRTN